VWQLTLSLPGSQIRETDLAAIVEAFHRLHEQHYSVRAEQDPIEITEWNLIAIGRAAPVGQPRAAERRISSDPVRPSGRRSAYLMECGGAIDLPVFHLDHLNVGDVVTGPALIQDKLTVTLITPGATASLTGHQSILISLAQS
jgi:N-methylhydantoinase A